MTTFDTEDMHMEDLLDIRNIIERFEEIEDSEDADEKAECAKLKAILEDLKGNSGDEQWRGDWYPVTLIRDSYFNDAMD